MKRSTRSISEWKKELMLHAVRMLRCSGLATLLAFPLILSSCGGFFSCLGNDLSAQERAHALRSQIGQEVFGEKLQVGNVQQRPARVNRKTVRDGNGGSITECRPADSHADPHVGCAALDEVATAGEQIESVAEKAVNIVAVTIEMVEGTAEEHEEFIAALLEEGSAAEVK